MRIVAVALLMLAVAGCDTVRVVTRPGPTVYKDRLVVEPVADELTEERPIATGTLAECPLVAKQRAVELQICNAQLRAIRAKHGKGSK